MSNDDILSYIRMCASKDINSPIRIEEIKHISLAMNLLINKSTKKIDMFIRFNKGVNSHILLDVLNQDKTVKNLIDFLSIEGAELNILSNQQKIIRESKFINKLDKFKNIKIRAVEFSTFVINAIDDKALKVLDVVIGDKAVITGNFADDSGVRLVNFSDESLYAVIRNYYLEMNKMVKVNE